MHLAITYTYYHMVRVQYRELEVSQEVTHICHNLGDIGVPTPLCIPFSCTHQAHLKVIQKYLICKHRIQLGTEYIEIVMLT